MADYRYLVGDVRTGAIRGELELTGVSYSNRLSGPGGFGADVAKYPPRGGVAVDRSMLEPSNTTLWVERDGELVWGGIVWSVDGGSGNPTFRISAQGFSSYLRRVFINKARLYSGGSDLFTIVSDLFSYLATKQALPYGITTVSYTPTLAGKTIPAGELLEYWDYQHQNFGEAIDQIAAYGFEYDVAYAWSGNTPTFTHRFFAPKKSFPTGLVFGYGEGSNELVIGYDYTLDGLQQANSFLGIGFGDGPAALSTQVQDPAVLDGGYPFLEGIFTDKDIRAYTQLVESTQEQLNYFKRPVVTPTVTLDPTIAPAYGSYSVGDEVTIDIRDGYINETAVNRILEIGVSITETDVEQVTITPMNKADQAA